jgi:hypothetical protein
MEENIEYWHQTKLEKYGALQSEWKLYYFCIEVGCRGFVPSRFSGVCRQLGFSSVDFKRVRNNLQLVARKCSYIIWLNRFNKDFNSSFRISVDGLLGVQASSESLRQEQVPSLSQTEKARVSENREAALLRLRASRNRKAALIKLRASTFKYKAVKKPGLFGADCAAGKEVKLEVRSPNKVMEKKVVKRVRFASPLVESPLATEAKEEKLVSSSLWTLMESPGLSLRNSLNKCWYHASLHLLSAIPRLRTWCVSSQHGLSLFERRFLNAIRAIVSSRSPAAVNRFFPLVRDFDGVNRRYGQVAAPDFIEYLCNQSANLSPLVKFTLSTQLQCSKCLWVSRRSSSDVFLKLHLPVGRIDFTLAELVDYNSNVVLSDSDAVFCGQCNVKTSHNLSREYNPDLLVMEVVRATEASRNTWVKNDASLNFAVTNLKLPGFPRTYRVVSTCHHRGSVGLWSLANQDRYQCRLV